MLLDTGDIPPSAPAGPVRPGPLRADEVGMKREMTTKTALVGLAASLAGLAVASVAYFGRPRAAR